MMRSGAISVRSGMFPEMKTTEPYSPSARANASANPVTAAGTRIGSSTWRNVCQRPAPSTAAASSSSASRSSSTGCTVRMTNGRPMNVSAIVTPSGREGGADPERLEEPADPAVLRVDGGEGDARDRRRQRERQVHERVDERSPREAVAREHPRDEDAEDDVHRGGDERGAEGEPVRRERPRRGDDAPGVGPGERARAERQRRERHEHDDAEVEDRDPGREAEPGEHPGERRVRGTGAASSRAADPVTACALPRRAGSGRRGDRTRSSPARASGPRAGPRRASRASCTARSRG